ncbi:hypothetical protein [Shimia biformata]|uniref:hypothetical protein n=1 Tax=Shimia biformata TaxID=1294299 RepID=UPI00194F1FAE|nr:hypothetical protein [Shimia biformata]
MLPDVLGGDMFADIAVATATIVLGVWVPAYFSLRGFRTRQWWEKKADAYQQAISVLAHEMHYFDTLMEDDVLRRNPTPEQRATMTREFDKARSALDRLRFESAFLFSDQCREVLDSHFRSVDGLSQADGNHVDYLDSRAALSRAALDQFIVAAKRDLKV